jgi:hypothetical protein
VTIPDVLLKASTSMIGRPWQSDARGPLPGDRCVLNKLVGRCFHQEILVAVASAALMFASCSRQSGRPAAPYLPLAQIEASYGALVTAGNHPTPDQHGTGERIGLFRDTTGTIWGLPLTVAGDGAVFACAPNALHDAKVTDALPAGSVVIGSTNEPTGWRGGTGNLELLLRDPSGIVHWQAVRGGQLSSGPVCLAPASPGPPQQLHYYRLAPRTGGRE